MGKKHGGGGLVDGGSSITTDANGNVYTTGTFTGTVDFNPNAGTSNLTSNGGPEIFILKLDASGNFLWAISIGGINYDRSFSITTDAYQNVYTTGLFEGTVDFNPGTGTNSLTSNGNTDAFIQKLDSNGNFLWAKGFGSVNLDNGWSVTIDLNGNIYSTGRFEGTVDFDPGIGTSNLTSSGPNAFIQKLDSNGNFVWAINIGGSDFDYGLSIAIDTFNNIYTAGSFSGIVDFDPGTGTSNLISNGSNDAFIQKLDVNGNFIWAIAIGGSADDRGNSITTDLYGNTYTTGHFSDTVNFDSGIGTNNLTSNGWRDAFIQKLDANGNFIWAINVGGGRF